MKDFTFEVHGPFDISVQLRRGTLHCAVGGFWETERALQGIARRSGCYVLAVRSEKSLTPYYVGLTARCFKDEVFNPTNLPKYERALRGGWLRRPVIFLITHPRRHR